MGPTLPFSEALHASKYRGKNECFKEAMNRVASTLADDPEHFRAFRDILLDMRFLPAGRVQSAIGSTRAVTPYNCFVSGTIEDSFVDGPGSIMQRAAEAAATMRMGGGIGYDFSTLRPRGDLIRKLASHSSGPISFMEIFDAICRCVASSGHRRGAQMGVLRVDHPDIEDFVRAKHPGGAAEPILAELARHTPGTPEWQQWQDALQVAYRLTGFNVSVAVTDEFMEAVYTGTSFDLRFDGRTYRTVDARTLYDTIMRSTWDWAEPGVLFIDEMNRMNNLWYCEQIAATNPCSEQPLPPFGACLLGSFNLVKYLVREEDGWKFDFDQFARDIPVVVRAMDNVVDKAVYPLPAQEQMAKATRRMGLGVTGVANALEAQGHAYGTPEFTLALADTLRFLCRQAYLASAQLAEQKGAFPLFQGQYHNGRFIEQLDNDVRDRIKRFGIRNSHLLSIAPTGTISMCADNVSSGIEPVFAYRQKRVVNMPEGQVETEFDDYGWRVLRVPGRRCHEVSVSQHLAVLVTAQRFVDSAVSKTCNVPSSTPWADFKNLYIDAWQNGCKGLTTYQVGGRRSGILTSIDEGEEGSCRIDPETGRKDCDQ